jgi:dipeptidyl aminopeptidase/acylaminoacyl peptidase
MTALIAEMIVDLSLLTDLAVTPDGTQVAYTVKPVGKKDEHPQSAIWLAPLDGSGPPRQLTAGTAEDRAPQWSADGKQIAFLSDRARRGTMQLYVIDLGGGEARALTGAQNKRPVLKHAWSPAGERIAFTSADEPDAEEERREKERDDPEVFGERWQHARLRLVNVATGDITTLVSIPRHIAEFAWSPGGDALAWVSGQAPPLEFVWRALRFERVAASGGTPQTLCEFPKRADSLVWSSDSETLLFLGGASGRAQASTVVWSLPAVGGTPKRLALGETSCAMGLDQPPGAPHAVVNVAEGLHTRLCWLDTQSGAIEPFYQAGHPSDTGDISAWSVRTLPNGDTAIAVARSSSSAPSELWGGVIKAREYPFVPQVISNHQKSLGEVRFAKQQEFRWQAEDGLQLDGVLIRPPVTTEADPKEPFPMITLVHGGPYGRSGLGLHLGWGAWGQWLALAGYLVLLPNPRGGLDRKRV